MLRQARLATLAGRVRPVCRRWLSDNAIATSVTSDKSKLSTQVNEPTLDPDTVQAFTGTPAEMLETRVVKIYQPSQGVQNANQNTLVWKMQWEDAQTERWSNPLMGWTSTNDPLSNTHMTLEFDSAESAARFCMHNGVWPQAPTLPSSCPHRSPALAPAATHALSYGRMEV